MPKKIYDLGVKTGTYTDANGETKGRWENVGSVLQMDDGGKLILLKRSFNPAGVPFKDGSDQIALAMFEPKKREGAPQQAKPGNYAPSSDEDIPF